MADTCYSGTNVPSPVADPCEGDIRSTDCVASPSALTYLSLPIGATQTQINAAIITFLLGKDAQIADLQAQINALDARIIDLETP